MDRLFEIATRKNYQFNFKGLINVIDLWNLSLKELDSIFKSLNAQAKQAKEESLLVTKSAEDTTLQNKIELIKYIVSVKQQEIESLDKIKANREKREKILDIINKKEDNKLEEMSVEELKKALCEIES